MDEIIREWQSFWDIASPRHAAEMLAQSYGSAAVAAAERCALAAQADDRLEDKRFWRAVLRELDGQSLKNRSAKSSTNPVPG